MLPGLWGGTGGGMSGRTFQHQDSHTWLAPNLVVEQVRRLQMPRLNASSRETFQPTYVPEYTFSAREAHIFAQQETQLQQEHEQEANKHAAWIALFRSRMRHVEANILESEKLAHKLVAHMSDSHDDGCTGRLTAEEAGHLGACIHQALNLLQGGKEALLMSGHIELLYPTYISAEKRVRHLDTVFTSAQEEGIF
jgi:hypothetical protein